MEKPLTFVDEAELPTIIQSVVLNKPGAQVYFIESLPSFFKVMNPTQIQEQMVPFLINWLDLGNRTVAIKLSELLPSFFFPLEEQPLTTSLLFPLIDLLRESAIFIEPQMLKFCKHIISTYNSQTIEDFFLPALDQLNNSSYTDSQGLAFLMQSYFIPYVSSKWAQIIYNHSLSLINSKGSYPKIKLFA